MAAAGSRSKGSLVAEINKLFAIYDRHHDGVVGRGEITAILTKLQGGYEEGEVVGLLRMVSGTSREDVTISKDEFTRWFLAKHKGTDGQRLNRMLIKDPLGATRHTSYHLPPADFAFGIKAVPDAHGAKACLTGWHAPDQRQGRKSKRPARSRVPEGAVFGRPRPPKDCDTGDVLRNAFGERPRRQDPEYAANSKISKPRVAAAATVRPTHAYTLAARRARAMAAAAGKGADPAEASGPGAGTMAAAAMAAAATAAGRTDGKVRLNGEGDWKIRKFSHAKPTLDTFATRAPDAYKEMLRRDGKLKPRKREAPAAEAKADEAEAPADE